MTGISLYLYKSLKTNSMNTDQNQNKSDESSKIIEPFKITGDWEAQSKLLKAKFSQLTSEDLKFIPGSENDLVKRVSSRLNKNHEEVISIIKKSSSENLVQ
jgi:hypothetical protein